MYANYFDVYLYLDKFVVTMSKDSNAIYINLYLEYFTFIHLYWWKINIYIYNRKNNKKYSIFPFLRIFNKILF